MGHTALAQRKAHRKVTYIPLEICAFLCLCPCPHLAWEGSRGQFDEGKWMPQERNNLLTVEEGDEKI